MSVDYKVRQIYNETIHEVTKTPENWKEVLSLMGQIYRYEFDNILMVYAQKPNSTLVADFDTWKKVDRYVLRGSRGIAIYPSRALSPHCRYVFDISDTGGRKRQLTWNLDGENLEHYAGYLEHTGELDLTGVDRSDREALKNAVWDFTKDRIDGIIKESHAKRGIIKEAVQSMIDNVYGTGLKADGTDLATRSIYYVVAGRCGFELSEEDKDFDRITAVYKEDVIYELGSYISDISCEALRGISRDINRMEQERRVHYERSIGVQTGAGWNVLPEHQHGEGGYHEDRQVRSDGDGLSEGEPLPEVQVTDEVRKADGGARSGERGSIPDDRQDDGEVSEKPQAGESGRHDGDVEDPAAGIDAGGGDRDSGSGEPVQLRDGGRLAVQNGHTPAGSGRLFPKPEKLQTEPEELQENPEEPKSITESGTEDGISDTNDPLYNEELNRELEDLDTFGERRDTGFEQMSLFPFQGSVLTEKEKQDIKEGKYTCLNPKIEDSVPHDYIVSVLKRGTGFVDGKKRVYNIMQTEPAKSERVRQIRSEFGLGGAGWPLEGYGLHGSLTF